MILPLASPTSLLRSESWIRYRSHELGLGLGWYKPRSSRSRCKSGLRSILRVSEEEGNEEEVEKDYVAGV